MKGIEALIKKATNLKEKGLTDKEIGDELHISIETVQWLLTKGKEGEKPPLDVKIGWRSLGVFGARMGHIADAMATIVTEEMKKRNTDFDAVLGIAINGIPFATLLSERTGRELMIYRPGHGKDAAGTFSSNYATPENKRVIIVDDVLSSGDTIRMAVKDLQDHRATPLLSIVMINKTGKDEISGVPLRALIRARTIA